MLPKATLSNLSELKMDPTVSACNTCLEVAVTVC
jgi:hypothetical protein